MLAVFVVSVFVVAVLVVAVLVVTVLGGLQGALGWYMVMSGLVDRVDVSQYRLAAHLGAAVLIFGFVFWVAVGLGRRAPRRFGEWPGNGFTLSALTGVLLIFVQILLGAFVAGTRAGLSHNTWPLMDGAWIPSGLGAMAPWYANLFENVQTVQFDHRIAAYAILIWCLIHVLTLFRRSAPGNRGAHSTPG